MRLVATVDVAGVREETLLLSAALVVPMLEDGLCSTRDLVDLGDWAAVHGVPLDLGR